MLERKHLKFLSAAEILTFLGTHTPPSYQCIFCTSSSYGWKMFPFLAALSGCFCPSFIPRDKVAVPVLLPALHVATALRWPPLWLTAPQIHLNTVHGNRGVRVAGARGCFPFSCVCWRTASVSSVGSSRFHLGS